MIFIRHLTLLLITRAFVLFRFVPLSFIFSVEFNGALCGYFKGAKGFHQGEPVSSVLSHILIPQEQILKFYSRCKSPSLKQLLFAGDGLLFCKADMKSTTSVLKKLQLFAKWSGLTPNPWKARSVLFHNCMDSFKQWFARNVGFPIGSLHVKLLKSLSFPFNYLLLSMFLYLKRLLLEIWSELLDSFSLQVAFNWSNQLHFLLSFLVSPLCLSSCHFILFVMYHVSFSMEMDVPKNDGAKVV